MLLVNTSFVDIDSSFKTTKSMTSKTLISDEARRIFQWICYGVATETVALFGTVTNVINIICFVKQGLRDSVNITLLGLAISDLGCLFTLLWANICFIPAFQESDLPIDTVDLQYVTIAWPHVMFTRVTGCITALITLERCLCITMPLKVKSILTPRRVKYIIVSFYVVLVCGFVPMYYANRLGQKFSPERNTTTVKPRYTATRYTAIPAYRQLIAVERI